MLEEDEIREMIQEIQDLAILVDGNDYEFLVVRDFTRHDFAGISYGTSRNLVSQIVVRADPIEDGGENFVGYTVGYDSNGIPRKGSKRMLALEMWCMATDIPDVIDGRKLAKGALQYLRPRIMSGVIWGEYLSEHKASVYPAQQGRISDMTSILQWDDVYSYCMTIMIRDTFAWDLNPRTHEYNPVAVDSQVGVRTGNEDYRYVWSSQEGS